MTGRLREAKAPGGKGEGHTLLACVQENALLLLGTILAVFFLSFGLIHKEMFSSLNGTRMPKSLYHFARRPAHFFRLAFRGQNCWALALFYLLTALFGAMSFFLLLRHFPFSVALALFLPAALLIALAFYYALWLGCLLLCRAIDVGDARLNALFSLVVIVTGLTYCGFFATAEQRGNAAAFYLAVFNLSICYFAVASALRFILQGALSAAGAFNHRNLWKVAITVIVHFLWILTLLCQAGYAYDPRTYTAQGLTLFDLFYYVVVTFGTVGYGDIAPVSVYGKAVAILIVFTSVACISIMLSSFLSVSSRK